MQLARARLEPRPARPAVAVGDASPTLPGLTKRQPASSRTSGRWVWPLTTQSASRPRAMARAAGAREVLASMRRAGRRAAVHDGHRPSAEVHAHHRGQARRGTEAVSDRLVGGPGARADPPGLGVVGVGLALGDLAVGVAHHAGPAGAQTSRDAPLGLGAAHHQVAGEGAARDARAVDRRRARPASAGRLAWTSPSSGEALRHGRAMPEGVLQARRGSAPAFRRRHSVDEPRVELVALAAAAPDEGVDARALVAAAADGEAARANARNAASRRRRRSAGRRARGAVATRRRAASPSRRVEPGEVLLEHRDLHVAVVDVAEQVLELLDLVDVGLQVVARRRRAKISSR